MTPEREAEIRKRAEFAIRNNVDDYVEAVVEIESLREQIAAAVAEEREACAKIADEYSAKCIARGWNWDDERKAADFLADAIRERGAK